MNDKPVPRWRELAGQAANWSLKAGAKGVELAKAEMERQRKLAAEREERNRIEAAERAEREQLAAAQKAESDRLAAEAAEQAEQAEKIQQVENEKAINAFFDNRNNNMVYHVGPESQEKVIEIVKMVSHKSPEGRVIILLTEGKFDISRPLTSFSNSEIEIIRYARLLHNFGLLNSDIHQRLYAAIAFNDGNCSISNWFCVSGEDSKGAASQKDLATFLMARQHAQSKQPAITAFLNAFNEILAKWPDHRLVQEFQEKLIGGSNWMSKRDLSAPAYAVVGNASRFLGATGEGQAVWFNEEGALITVAPPGSGKTQCHVFPTLLSYRGPAVVLDVKGECFDNTSAWRKANVGPVFKFNPLNPADSARYNPLAFLVNDPETLWEEARLMADLLIVPENQRDPSWENRARDVVAGIIAWMVRKYPPEERSMGKIIDIVNKIGWDIFLVTAASADDLPPLRRIGNAFAEMPERQLSGVLDAARRHLSVWEGTRVERVTAACDWTAQVLRDGSNSTVYICIPPNEIESYAPLLRVLFAQHLRQLMRTLPPRDQAPILFMLDELPRLGPMRPVEEALEIGRQYGIRLWLFAQSLGQLKTAYANADGMVGSCAMRIYMNPSAHDGTAKRLSEELGFVESIIDGSRKLMVEATDLTGPDYADVQIAFGRNSRPAKLKKVFAYQNPTFKQRMGAVAPSGGFAPPEPPAGYLPKEIIDEIC